MTDHTDVPSTEETLQEAKKQEKKTPAEQAVVNQEEALKSGAENPS
jgi:hypothetical protein